jgi:hypothetical protein
MKTGKYLYKIIRRGIWLLILLNARGMAFGQANINGKGMRLSGGLIKGVDKILDSENMRLESKQLQV